MLLILAIFAADSTTENITAVAGSIGIITGLLLLMSRGLTKYRQHVETERLLRRLERYYPDPEADPDEWPDSVPSRLRSLEAEARGGHERHTEVANAVKRLEDSQHILTDWVQESRRGVDQAKDAVSALDEKLTQHMKDEPQAVEDMVGRLFAQQRDAIVAIAEGTPPPTAYDPPKTRGSGR